MEKRAVDVVVISDVHLGTYGAHAKELAAYLKSISPNIVILNGDIIDGWQFSRHYFPDTHLAVIKEILNMMASGTRIFYITGNHDEHLRKYVDFEIGNFTLTNKLVLEIDGKMTWIFHGDVFDNTVKGGARILARLGSKGYEILMALNKCINSMLKFFGREKISISKKIINSLNKKLKELSDFESVVADLAIDKKYDYVICGHVHLPENKVLTNDHGQTTYLNSGDWIEHLTALEYHRNEWKIFQYDEKDFEHSPVKEEKLPINVLTDEINFYIRSLAG